MKVNIEKIFGNWTLGYALDKHMLKSKYLGDNASGYPQFDNTRTEVGEAVFQLKYRNDWNQVIPLASAVVTNIIPKFEKIGLVVPVPASKVRERQPVYEVANEIAKNLKIESFEKIVCMQQAKELVVPLKDLPSREKKVAALAGRFVLRDEIKSEGCWNALVVDDLYDSGASLEAVCNILQSYRKIEKIFVASLTWK